MKIDTDRTITVVVPEYNAKPIKIGGNYVKQNFEVGRSIELQPIGRLGSAYLFTDNNSIKYAIFGRGMKKIIDKSVRMLRTKQSLSSHEEISRLLSSQIVWENHPLANRDWSINDILDTWHAAFRIDGDGENNGLRKVQRGAVHALAAHWTVSDDPALVVMPTGTGKTETMLSVLVQHCCERVLVLVPSDVLREQICEKFRTLGCLKEIGVLENSALTPRVVAIRKGVKTISDAKDLVEAANILVATPNILQASSPGARETIAAACTHLFVDEAHHLTAKTWGAAKGLFESKRVVQFTATPFRNDKKHIDGSIIYNYPLENAQEDGIFRPIDFIPVDEIDEVRADRTIAEKAVERLRLNLNNNYDHLMLARSKSIARAEEVVSVYREIAGDLNPVLIHSRMGVLEQKQLLSRLEMRTSRILVCVDMFGEGFDFPQLKIAAVHDKHKSLPVLLQFVGRFTRHEINLGDASLIVNVADEAMSQELVDLYAQDADWNILLRRSAAFAIGREVRFQELVDSFGDDALVKDLPLWNLRPARSVVVMELGASTSWSREMFQEAFTDPKSTLTAISPSRKVAIAVWRSETDVKWGKYEDIADQSWNLVVAYWCESAHKLFVHASDYDSFNMAAVVKALTGAEPPTITFPNIFRGFSNFERPMARTLGASKTGTIRYTMYFGSDVAEGLSQLEQKSAVLSNVFAWGYDDGDRLTLGCSVRKGKIWARGGGGIDQWMAWCDGLAQRLNDSAVDGSKIFSNFLKPIEIKERPEGLVPLSIDWGQSLIEDTKGSYAICHGGNEADVNDVEVNIAEFNESGPIQFDIASSEEVSRYQIVFGDDIGGTNRHYHYEHLIGPVVTFRRGKGIEQSLEDFCIRNPFLITYVDNSFSYNEFFVAVGQEIMFEKSALMSADWSGVDITSESEGYDKKSDSIQFGMIESSLADYDVVFNDDGAGEMADIVAMRVGSDNRIEIHLVHCKYSGETIPGARIADFSEVCSQAVKSTKWKFMGMEKILPHIKKREAKWLAKGHTRFRKGSIADVARLERLAKRHPIDLTIKVVQPGLSISKVSDDILRLLGSVQEDVFRKAKAPLTVIGST